MAKEPSGESPPTDSDPFSEAEFGKNLVNLSNRFAANANHRFEFNKRSQLDAASILPLLLSTRQLQNDMSGRHQSNPRKSIVMILSFKGEL